MPMRKNFSTSVSDLLRGYLRLRQLCFLGKKVLLGKNVIANPMCIIEDNVSIGENTFIGYGCIIRSGSSIGDNCRFGHLTVIEGGRIYDEVHLHAQCHVGKGTVIREHVFSGPGVIFINVRNPSYDRDFKPFVQGSLIERGARIGTQSLIMPGVTIGEESLIGAKTLVTKNVPPYTIFYGNPGRVKGKVPDSDLYFKKEKV